MVTRTPDFHRLGLQTSAHDDATGAPPPAGTRGLAYSTGPPVLRDAFGIGYAGAAAPIDTKGWALIVGFASLPHAPCTGHDRATVPSIAEAIAAFIVLGAIFIGHMLGPNLTTASLRNNRFQGRKLDPQRFRRGHR
jgi:hypothetical protein